MSTIKDGGPAFPSEQHETQDGLWNQSFDSGMTLRDYFAAKAMQGLLANPGGPIQANANTGWGFCNCSAEYVAGLAQDMADAMLRAREVQS